MQPVPPGASTCANCGGVLEETPGGGLGCMSCLLQAGIGSEEEVVVHDSTPDALAGSMRFGVYEIDCHADGSLCELGRGAMGVTYRGCNHGLNCTENKQLGKDAKRVAVRFTVVSFYSLRNFAAKLRNSALHAAKLNARIK